MVSSSIEMAAIDLPTNSIQTTTVSDFYIGKTIFITGGTGFMGKVLLEKLLRACPGVYKIYVLIRPRRGQNAQERLQQLVCSPLFDTIKKERPMDLLKLSAIEGDITEPDLAISPTDRAILSRSVNIVFHTAATVKFDEKLKLSVTINMLGTQKLVKICKGMAQLEALIHVSTAYCNCDRDRVEEVIYPPPMEPDHVVSVVESLQESLVDTFTPNLIGNRPNTYTFTKAIAECWLDENRGDLPLVIVRPSIVISTINGPLKGWVDNWNGPTGILAAAGKGILRTMLCNPHMKADLVPVDMVINLMIVSAWQIGTQKSNELPIYNICTGQRKPITWSRFIDLCFQYMRKHPFSNISWYPDGTVTSSIVQNKVMRFILQWIPAYIIDGATWVVGSKPIMVKIQQKLVKATSCLEYFALREWEFDDRNVKLLSLKLSEADRREFSFDVAQINWEEYLENYILGIRSFIFKEDESSLPKARKSIWKFYWTYRIIQVAFVMSSWRFLVLRCPPLKQMWDSMLRFLVHMARMLSLTH